MVADRVAVEALLRGGERILDVVPMDGFFASEHNVSASVQAVITSERYLAVSERGTFKKRLEVEADWDLASFSNRVNSSEGTALGPFLNLLTLFRSAGETVSAGFHSHSDREAFKYLVANAITAAQAAS